MTTASYDGREIELAKLTLERQMKVVETDAETNLVAKANLMYETLANMVGDSLAEIVDGDTYETCDLAKLSDLYFVVTDAYGNDMNKSKLARQDEQVAFIKDMEEKIVLFNKSFENATRNVPGK